MHKDMLWNFTCGHRLLHFQVELQNLGELMEQGHSVRLAAQVFVNQHFSCGFWLARTTLVGKIKKYVEREDYKFKPI